MTFNIKKRIYISFFILASIFVVNGVIIVATIRYNNTLSRNISTVIDPSLRSLNDFKMQLILSREYSINWVFLRSNEEYKKELKEIQNVKYPKSKQKLLALSSYWSNSITRDSLNSLFNNVESSLVEEHKIMKLLSTFENYDEPTIKFSAEEILEDEVIPLTNASINSVENIISDINTIKAVEETKVARASLFIRILIASISVAIILLAFVLAKYMGKIIIRPINKIIDIVNDLGKGITKKVDYKVSNDEIGSMVHAVNHLSENLHASALFAKEIGNRNFNIDFVPLSSEDKLGQALITMRDNLKSSDESLNEAQRIALLGNWEWDIKKNKISWSDELFRILDLEPGDFKPTYEDFHNFIHPDDKEYAGSFLAKCAKDHQPYSYETRLISRKGVVKYIYAMGKVMLNEKSVIVKIHGIVQDITQRKKEQQVLEETHNQLQTLFNNIDEVFFTVDIESQQVLQISPACNKVYGYPEKSFYENVNLWKEVALQEDVEIIDKSYPLMLAGKSISHEYRIHHTDGSIHWIETKITPTLNDSGKLIRIDGVTSDTTKRKEDEAILKANLEELKKTNAELDKFVYSVSHDLRAPLLSMQGIIDIAAEETIEPLTGEYMGMLRGSVSRLDNFIGEILDYSRNARLDVKGEIVDVEKLLNEIIESLNYLIKSSNKIKVQVSIPKQVTIFTDKRRLRAVLKNLISNAINYRNTEIDNPYVQINVNAGSSEVHIEIADNGIGIDEEFHQKIFEMFYRHSEISTGSGLGLYIVKEAVDKINGKINVLSKPGEGTTISLNIPTLLFQ
ncbi:MAG: PAS domain-containing protein [Bacteroidota bacterium]